jgi:hypothetical protein
LPNRGTELGVIARLQHENKRSLLAGDGELDRRPGRNLQQRRLVGAGLLEIADGIPGRGIDASCLTSNSLPPPRNLPTILSWPSARATIGNRSNNAAASMIFLISITPLFHR